MTITYDIKDDIYIKLIQYALETSDAFLLVTLSSPVSSVSVAKQIELAQETLPSFKFNREIIENLRNQETENAIDAQKFRNCCIPFVKELEPYLIKQRHNPVWPSTEIISSPSTYNINIYGTQNIDLDLLVRPKSYFAWRYPYYPEDLSFFRQNRCWLYASSHEKYIEVLPMDRQEYDVLADMGIEFAQRYVPTSVKEMFFEKY